MMLKILDAVLGYQLAKRLSIPPLASMEQLKFFESLRGFDDYLLR
jgi:hypothetical protein